MNKKTKPSQSETPPLAEQAQPPAAIEAATPSQLPEPSEPTVDAAAVLDRRRSRQKEEAWKKARSLLLQASMTEGEIEQLADALDVLGLGDCWIRVFQAVLAAHRSIDGRLDAAAVEKLVAEAKEARNRLVARQQEVRKLIAELERELEVNRGIGFKTALQMEAEQKGLTSERAAAAYNSRVEIERTFRPLFDEAAALGDFALPRSIDLVRHPAIAIALREGGLIVDGKPVALTEAAPEYKPRRPTREPPTLRCSHGGPGLVATGTVSGTRTTRRKVEEATINPNFQK